MDRSPRGPGCACSLTALPLVSQANTTGFTAARGLQNFFKRTIRKDLTYSCRDNKDCTVDKRQRNRCQYCRYQKCLATGMKREGKGLPLVPCGRRGGSSSGTALSGRRGPSLLQGAVSFLSPMHIRSSLVP